MPRFVRPIDFRETEKRISVYYGNKQLPISIEQDAKYPIMWRIPYADGTLSDMVNKSRAKDTAHMLANDIIRRGVRGPLERVSQSAGAKELEPA